MTAQTSVKSQQVQFPIVEPFTVAQPGSYWRFLGAATLTGGSLQLTPDARAKAGTGFLDQPFSSSLGVTIDFDYECVTASGAHPGDGFCIYLIDGEHTTQPGGHGAALGYSVTKDGSTIVAEGVTAGYVGVGFDNYGNFASALAGTGGPGQTPNMVGVRGSGSGSAGFRWLTGAPAPGGFGALWEAGAHIQLSIIDGELTVRRSSTADPDGVVLIDSFDLAAAPDQIALPPTFKLGFAAGTGAAIAAHRIKNLTVALPAAMSLSMGGPSTAKAGDRISYQVQVENAGPNDAPDALVEGTMAAPLSDLELSCTAHNGASCGTGSITAGLRQPVSLPRGGKATITVSGTIDSSYEGSATSTTSIASPTRANTASQRSGSVTTQVDLPLVSADVRIVGQWAQSWPEDATGWVISYELGLHANEHRVVNWQISFDVPANTRVNPQQTQWYRVIKDGGTDGSVALGSPAGAGHTIEPGTPLVVAIQLLYRSQHDAGEGTLRNLRVTETTTP
jgi:uncharacterized repeat protein (TIGR01451 family)